MSQHRLTYHLVIVIPDTAPKLALGNNMNIYSSSNEKQYE